MRLFSNWRIAAKILPIVIFVIMAKSVVHLAGWERLELNALFSAVIGATVFLIGFMISGTLSDYKESERLPSDLAASLFSIADECATIKQKHGKKAITECSTALNNIAVDALDWMRNQTSVKELLRSIDKLNSEFVSLEPFTETTFISRLKSEQSQLRKIVLRMVTIRETSFIGSAYAVAEVSSLLLVTGLIFVSRQPFGESLFFIGFITFVLAYMIALITDLDNPYDYSNEIAGNEVSLKPIELFKQLER